VTLRVLTGPDIAGVLPDLARLRIAVFREWPYLYDGTAAYEEAYLEVYAQAEGAVVVGAYDGDRLVGAATGCPMLGHSDDFSAAFADTAIQPADVFYCAESVLLPAYRGRGIGHAFFDAREAHGKALGYPLSAFCAVIRREDHPERPADYTPLDGFWRKRGYAPLAGAVASFTWQDIGDPHELQ